MSEVISGWKETVLQLADKLQDKHYAFRGTTSLVLQGLDMNVDDIDILCGKQIALEWGCKYSEAKIYKSYFGQFNINNVLVEMYAEWKIKDQLVDWQRIKIRL